MAAMLRNRRALLIYLLLLSALVGGLLWRLGDLVPGAGTVIGSGQIQVGGPFRLVDQNGRTRTDADFRGKYMLVYFGFTHCPDVCPTSLAAMAQALDMIGDKAARVTPVFITVDPARDTPKVVGEYMKAFGPTFVGLTGSQAAVDAAAKQYRVYATRRDLPGGQYAMDHSNVVYLMGPDGKIVSYYNDAITPEILAKDLNAHL